jgi:putative endonuclease
MYVVKCSDGTFYTGVTTDLDRRVAEHNNSNKGAKYTATRRPVKLIYAIEKKDRSSACKAESKFKKLSRKEKLKTMNQHIKYLI